MAHATRVARFGGRPAARGRNFTRADLSLHTRHFRGRYHAAAIVAVAVLVLVGFRMFPQREVTVLSNGQAYRVSSTFDGPAESLGAADIALSPGDRVLVASGGKHQSVAVSRASLVTIETDGRVLQLRTRASTIGGALAEAGIGLHAGDRITIDGQVANVRGPLAATAVVSRSPGGIASTSSRPGAPATRPIQIAVTRAKTVAVYIDTLRVEIASAAPTVEGVLGELGMAVREGDLVRPKLDAPVTAGMAIRLAKARTVNVKLDGKEQALYTQAGTVADVLRLLGLDPGPDDLLSPPRETPVTANMEIVIGLTRLAEEQRFEAIPAPVEYETDSSLRPDSVRLIPGVEGTFVRTFSVTFKNGVEVGRVETGSAVVEAPIAARHITGSRAAPPRPAAAAPVTTPPSYSRTLTVRATWYNATHGGKGRGDPGYGITYTGVPLDYGICAVDPSVIPLWTWIEVPGYGKCLAADIGNAVRGYTIDLGFPESAGNNPWATRTLEIYILD